MASYAITWRNSTKKDLRKIRPDEIPGIIEAVEALAENPLPDGCTKLAGSQHIYRIRVGDYRVIYEVIGRVLIIEVIRVAHRKEVYR
jgi:mRNA interferase RelE/StbE